MTRRSKANTDMTIEASYVTAIAQPRMIDGWSPIKKNMMKKQQSTNTQRALRVDDSPDFRITKNTGV